LYYLDERLNDVFNKSRKDFDGVRVRLKYVCVAKIQKVEADHQFSKVTKHINMLF